MFHYLNNRYGDCRAKSLQNFPQTSLKVLQHSTKVESHPLQKSIRLMVCPISRSLMKQHEFQQSLKFSSSPGKLVHRSNVAPMEFCNKFLVQLHGEYKISLALWEHHVNVL